MSSTELAPLTHDEAQRLTERIRTALDRVASAWCDLSERVQEAFDRRADRALGYASWADYAEAELKPSSPLAVEVRREIVGLLSAQGMSTRAIAPAVGVKSDQTIRRDLAEVRENHAPAPTVAQIDGMTVDTSTGEVLDEVPAPITGLDGKTYTRPEPAAPRTAPRRSITDQFFDAAYDLSRAVEKVHRLTQDDRWAKNKEQIARKHGSDLLQAADLMHEIQRAMHNNNSQGV